MKEIIAHLVQKASIQEMLDFASDFNVPEDHVYFEFMRFVFLKLNDQVEIEKYYDSLELIRNVIPAVANKEKLISILTEVILPYIPAYEYSSNKQHYSMYVCMQAKYSL